MGQEKYGKSVYDEQREEAAKAEAEKNAEKAAKQKAEGDTIGKPVDEDEDKKGRK